MDHEEDLMQEDLGYHLQNANASLKIDIASAS
jgi:hypothetical protein